MHVRKRFLNAEMCIRACFAFTRIDAKSAHFADDGVIDLNGRHEAEFVIGRPERGIALEYGSRKNQCLDQNGLAGASEHIVCAGSIGRLRADRCGQAPRFDQRVGNARERQKPVRPPLCKWLERLVALINVVVVWVVPWKLETQAVHDAPAIRYRDRFTRHQWCRR